MMAIIEYTEEEKQLVRDIYASPLTIISQLHLLPCRTKESIAAKAKTMGLVKVEKAPLRDRIAELMSDGKCRTAEQIEAVLGEQRKYIAAIFREKVPVGEYHIHAYIGRLRAMVFKAGPGPNAVKPPPFHAANAAHTRAYRARQRKAAAMSNNDTPKKEVSKRRHTPRTVIERADDARYSAPATWWPKADPVVCGAMHAMVEAGRSAP